MRLVYTRSVCMLIGLYAPFYNGKRMNEDDDDEGGGEEEEEIQT